MNVQADRLTKSFGGAPALRGVDLTIESGSVHGLIGENGAGKSTLGRIVAGVIQPDAGRLLLNGSEVHFNSPRDALLQGTTIVEQELSLVPELTVVDNVFLGVEPSSRFMLDRSEVRGRYDALESQVTFGVPPMNRVGELPHGQRQKVEILRALARGAQVIVFDEPTAALTARETADFLQTLARLRSDGRTAILVSHFIEDILAVTDRVTVLRDGLVSLTADTDGVTRGDLVEAMLGRKLAAATQRKQRAAPDATIVLEARGISTHSGVKDVSLEVRRGEIVALAGLVGSGRSEAARAIFGADQLTSGEVFLDGVPLSNPSPKASIRRGLSMLPEDRKSIGLHLNRGTQFNVTLPHLHNLAKVGVLTRSSGVKAKDIAGRLNVKYQSLQQPVAQLSGGNQQKVLFCKWLLERPVALIADEPTRGVDVGAKAAIYDLLNGLAADGMGILMISSELEEVQLLADRILVMHEGRIVNEIEGHTGRADDILRAALGVVDVQLGESGQDS